jgi:hypothetical protein
MSLNRSQTAYLVNGVGCFLQIFWISHIELPGVVFDDGLALRAARDAITITETFLLAQYRRIFFSIV